MCPLMLYENSTFSINSYSADHSYFVSKNSKIIEIENIIATYEGEVMIFGIRYDSYKYPFHLILLNIPICC